MSADGGALRRQLLTRREDLAILCSLRTDDRIADLLRQVDAVLAEAHPCPETHCAACGEAVAALSPASRNGFPSLVGGICLQCLSPSERQALERDLERAAVVQRSRLPPAQFGGGCWQAAWLWEPLGAVSGDFIDLLSAGEADGPFHLLSGDVVGKGVAASLLQSQLHGLFRGLAAPDQPAATLLSRSNRLFFASTTAASYASLLSLRLDAGGSVELANAGHPRPLLADRRGVRPVEGSGFPLGLFANAEWSGRSLRLAVGDTLLLYTDGWTEAARGEEEYGIGRAAATFRRAAHLPLPDLLAACKEDMESFQSGSPRTDDLSLVALRRAA